MENILHDFNEKVISLLTNCLKNSITEKGISDFTNDLESEMIRFGSEVTQFLVEYAENIIFKLKDRYIILYKYLNYNKIVNFLHIINCEL